MSLQNLSFTSELYNVPTNNTAVMVQPTPTPSTSSATDSTLDYFTESDRLPSDQLPQQEDIYFVDAPPPAPVTPSNYLPTQIIARFSDEVRFDIKFRFFI